MESFKNLLFFVGWIAFILALVWFFFPFRQETKERMEPIMGVLFSGVALQAFIIDMIKKFGFAEYDYISEIGIILGLSISIWFYKKLKKVYKASSEKNKPILNKKRNR